MNVLSVADMLGAPIPVDAKYVELQHSTGGERKFV